MPGKDAGHHRYAGAGIPLGPTRHRFSRGAALLCLRSRAAGFMDSSASQNQVLKQGFLYDFLVNLVICTALRCFKL